MTENRLLFGECNNLRDAEDFISIKRAIDGWKCLVHPFPYTFRTIYMQKIDASEPLPVEVPASWAFVLHNL